MSKKNTLLFVDDEQVKIIFGSKLKCIKFADLLLDHNQKFLDHIFYSTNVVRVDKVARLDRDSFNKFVGQIPEVLGGQEPQEAQGAQEPKGPEGAPLDRAPAVSDPMTPRPKTSQITQSVDGMMPQDGGDVYIVSNDDRMTIMLDDVFTGTSIMRDGVEVHQTVALLPNKPVNLATVDQKSLKASKILPRMVKNGTVRQVSYDEAMDLVAKYEEQASNIISAHDSPGVSILDDSSPGSARRMAQGISEGSVQAAAEAETIEVSSRNTSDSVNMDMASHENSQSMDQLMLIMNEEATKGNLTTQTTPFTGVKKAGGGA